MRRADPYAALRAAHALRRPKLTATRHCNTCGGKHAGGCDLVPVPDRPVPTWRRRHA